MNKLRLEKYYGGHRVFTTKEVWDILDIKRGRLQEWIKGEFISYSKIPVGKRVQIVFTYEQLYSLALFQLLKDSGFDRARASSYSHFMNGKWEETKNKNYKYMIIKFEGESSKPSFSKSQAQIKDITSGEMLSTILYLPLFIEDVDNKVLGKV